MVASFFTPVKSEPVKSEYSIISVGEEQFQALAVALIDLFQSDVRVNEDTLKKILERFYAHFPQYKSTPAYLIGAVERMERLLNDPQKSKIVGCMAYVLRQLAWDELFARPLNNREVFEGLSANTLQRDLRQSNTPIPASNFRALTQKILGIPITLSFKEQGKDLRLRQTDLSRPSNPRLEVVIQVQGNQYFPRVRNKANFAHVGKLAVSLPIPVESTTQQTATIAHILDIIATDNEHLFQSFDQWRKTLSAMVTGGDLTQKKDWINLYTEFLPVNTGATGIQDSRRFFAQLEQARRKPVISDVQTGSDKAIIASLIYSLSGWLGAKQINPVELLNRLDNPASKLVI